MFTRILAMSVGINLLTGCPSDNGGDKGGAPAPAASPSPVATAGTTTTTTAADGTTTTTAADGTVTTTTAAKASEKSEKAAAKAKVYGSLSLTYNKTTVSLYDYGSKTLNSETSYSVTLINNGEEKATSIAIKGLAGMFSATGANCGTELAGGASCTIPVVFKPTAIGSHDAKMSVSYDDGKLALAATTGDLSLLGAALPKMTGFAPASSAYGNALTITGENFTANSVVKLGTTICPITTRSATQLVCTLPSGMTGAQVISVIDGTKSDMASGFTYLAPASLAITGATNNFGTVRYQNSAALTFTITNSGAVAATGLTFNRQGPSFTKTSDTCSGTVAANSTCTFIVTLTPTGHGTLSANDNYMSVSFNNGTGTILTSATYGYQGVAAKRVMEIATGAVASCARYSDRSVSCWGSNLYGQLGNGSATTVENSVPVTVTGIGNATQISVSDYAACARLTSSTLQCWGAYNNDDLVMGTKYTTPQDMGISDVAEVKVSINNICVRRTDGAVYCKNEGRNGQLGNGASNSATAWTQVNDFGNTLVATAISSNSNGAANCALNSDGNVYCWGGNGEKLLGDANTSLVFNTPHLIDNLANVTKIGAGGGVICALKTANELRCWGNGNTGPLGDGLSYTTLASYPNDPVQVTNLSNVASFNVGNGVACAVLTDATAKCWGANNQKVIKNDATLKMLSPVALPITGISQMSSSGNFSCALKTNGDVQCWGYNANGRLGDGTSTATTVDAPVSII